MSSIFNTSSRGSKIWPGPLQSIPSADLDGFYQGLGSFLNPARVFTIVNDSNQGVFISWDGVTDNHWIPAQSFRLIDVAANREVSDIFDVPNGIKLWIKGTAGTGNIYMEYFYALVT